ncbi:TIGR04283 family arsenosugar biosynthesis glycosyltransferase [Candidatus Enterococcus murrayae]|uniref:4,4'-diaponeurosporenoate glycosyltransferase n=1 Tax=Candidatus Enterococcus murrayae TaxID=2815321 RepID=A0ABS3HBG5_9ENTE|nr:TIGR04283 family arsenosugar biosynthesis glycosyltransferase [Enterococcus sp. MJM16]MBO0450805.1 TIGR04283 family arsenosugar biosynthesis glycosyltransferase [Enterococcus sp. MJM16]
MISIIIPVLNEEMHIERLLQQLSELETSISYEIIVVDGGSQDQTVMIARKLAQVYQLKNTNRGAQLKYGVEKSSGEFLWFLHGDSRLGSTRNLLEQIQSALGDDGCSAGFFKLSFDSSDFFYRYLAITSNLRARYLGLIFGDQGMFTKRSCYEKIGGFEPIPLMEDWRLSRRLKQLGKFYQLPVRIITSSRRFHKGKLRTHLKMHKIKLFYLMGMSPDKLMHRYYK